MGSPKAKLTKNGANLVEIEQERALDGPMVAKLAQAWSMSLNVGHGQPTPGHLWWSCSATVCDFLLVPLLLPFPPGAAHMPLKRRPSVEARALLTCPQAACLCLTKVAEFGSIRLQIHEIWAESDQVWTDLAEIGQNWACHGQCSTNFCQIRPMLVKVGPSLTHTNRSQPNSAENWPIWYRC